MLEETDWHRINKAIRMALDQAITPQFTQGEVIKADPVNNLIWLIEFGDQPIPLFTFDYEITYYTESPKGTVIPAVGSASPYKITVRKTDIKRKEVKVICPKKGDIVLVARQYGSRRLPKCLGVLKSDNFVIPE